LFWYAEISPTVRGASCRTLGIFGKLLMSNKGALTWFEAVWSYGVEAINDY
jgi:hypothetical protein